MNHKKFIQLLNLYIDGEASPAEARDVQRAIENDPARRRIYHEYCRIQTATRAVYDQFRTAGEEARPERALVGRMRAAGVRSAAAHPGRGPGHPFRRALFWTGGAAAACLALALAFWSMPHMGGPQEQAETAESPGVSVPTNAPAIAASAPAPAPTTTTPSYAAPLAGQVRIDPFLIQSTGPSGDPFSLASAARPIRFNDPEVVLSAVPSFAPARPVPAKLEPASTSIDPARVAEQNRKLQAILRGEIARDGQPQGQGPAAAPKSGAAVPVKFSQQQP